MGNRINAPGLLALTERAALRTEFRESHGGGRNAPEPRRLPVITISREIGASGTEVAGRVAKALGFELWDHELLDAIAARSHTPERLLEAVDERGMSRLDETLTDVFLGSQSSQTHYLDELRKLIDKIAAKGGSVIVGRGANLLLGDRPALHARVVASIDARVERLGVTRELSAKPAAQLIHKTDRGHATFIRRHFDVDIANPAIYDLCVNTATMPLEDATSLIIAAYERRFGSHLAQREAASKPMEQATAAR